MHLYLAARQTLWLVPLTLVTTAALAPACCAEDLSRLVTVRFQSAALLLPPGQSKTSMDQVTITLPGVAECLSNFQIDSIAIAFPDFNLADTLGVARTGEHVRLTDYSNIFNISLHSAGDRESVMEQLKALPEVMFAEGNYGVTFWGAPVYPNDEHFVTGQQYGMWTANSGGVEADIDAPEGWAITQGSAANKIAIIDAGFDGAHPEFTNRVSGSGAVDSSLFAECNNHGFMVAGVAGAKGNNSDGVAGMDWTAGLRNSYISATPSTTDIVNAIRASYQDPRAYVLNESWTLSSSSCGQDCNFTLVHGAVMDAYKLNRISVAAMGNTGGSGTYYPAAWRQGVIAVGATNQTGNWANFSTIGSHIDVVAPGQDILSTSRTGYATCSGTSFATPVVSGLASLLLAKDSTLYNDDVQNIIQLSADDIRDQGIDGWTGWGRVNAGRALKLTDSPNVFRRGTAFGMSKTPLPDKSTFIVYPGYSPTTVYFVRPYEIQTTVNFGQGTFTVPPRVWGRGVGTGGFSDENPIWGAGWCDTLPGVTQNSATLRTYVYAVLSGQFGVPIDTIPDCNLGDVGGIAFNWSALQIRRADSLKSFYVPEAGDTINPIEGTTAAAFFRTCPNNDPLSFAQSARLKILVRDSQGSGVAGIPASEIFVQFNGGTAAQGFVGDGADSIIANSTYNSSPPCPDVRAIYADGPTDGAGMTYMTLRGVDPAHRGVGARDPARKWGHYDSDIAVYVQGTRLGGHLSVSDSTAYAFRIKNVDLVGGLGTGQNMGELVAGPDVIEVLSHQGDAVGTHPLDYWYDIDSSGTVTGADVTTVLAHLGHDCDTVNNP